LLDTSLHKLAHALFEMLRLPVLGRKEDAADQVSAYIMLQLGKVEARRLIGGVACAYKTEAGAATPPPTMTHFADLHGTPAQRFYNVLCIAYGADKQLFGDIVEKGYLPKERGEAGRAAKDRSRVARSHPPDEQRESKVGSVAMNSRHIIIGSILPKDPPEVRLPPCGRDIPVGSCR
jgi:Putative metallopeptidase